MSFNFFFASCLLSRDSRNWWSENIGAIAPWPGMFLAYLRHGQIEEIYNGHVPFLGYKQVGGNIQP